MDELYLEIHDSKHYFFKDLTSLTAAQIKVSCKLLCQLVIHRIAVKILGKGGIN